MFFLVSAGNYIFGDGIRAVVQYNGSFAKNEYQAAKAQNRLYDLTRGKAIKSLVIYNDNRVIATPKNAATIIKNLNGDDTLQDNNKNKATRKKAVKIDDEFYYVGENMEGLL